MPKPDSTSPRCPSLLGGIAIAVLAMTIGPDCARAQAAYEQLQTFSSLLAQIRLNYVDSVTTSHLVIGAINGMLASLDPHSYYLAHDDATKLDAWRSGHLAATGIIVGLADNAVVVQSVYPHSPAARAGVAAGDRIVALNDTAVAGLGAEAVQSRLVGERGSRVRVLLERGPRLEPESVTVSVRNDEIHPQTVVVAGSLDYGIGYVRLEEFLPQTGRELRDAVGRALRDLPHRLILDLRGNPGGALEAAVDAASLFLQRDQLVFRTTGRRRDVAHEYRTQRDGEFKDLAMVVLIDETSASAAEALAGSLQDHDRALIAGRRSFGKALMQQAFLVPPNDDVVWLTVGYVLTPAGRLIQRRYRGLSVAEYERRAGRPGAPEDTMTQYHTDAGRIVRAGGGILPDTVLPAPPPPPGWWIAAADSGFIVAVADSVATVVGADRSAREAWLAASGEWQRRLLAPLLVRVRRRLGVRAEPDSATAERMAISLAARVAEVRWGVDAEDELRVRYDPDIRAAVLLFPRIRAMLNPSH